jgi:hypothetical protein
MKDDAQRIAFQHMRSIRLSPSILHMQQIMERHLAVRSTCNSTNPQSQDVQSGAAGNNVYVIWLERNQTSNEPFLIVSNDNGKTHS